MQEVDSSWLQTAAEKDTMLKTFATQLLASLKRLAAQAAMDEAQPAPWAALVVGMQGHQSCGSGQLARDKVTSLLFSWQPILCWQSPCPCRPIMGNSQLTSDIVI